MQDKQAVKQVVRWRLEKFDGDPPKPGEKKEPIEVIEGGDDIKPRIVKERKQDAVD